MTSAHQDKMALKDRRLKKRLRYELSENTNQVKNLLSVFHPQGKEGTRGLPGPRGTAGPQVG